MAVELTLSHHEGNIIAAYQGRPLTDPTPLANLPRITDKENPYRYDPVGPGRKLLAAMGGPSLLDLLKQDPDNLLLLVTDETSAAVPWEYAATAGSNFLAVDYGFLRLLPAAKISPPPAAGPLNLVVLAADPLLDSAGRPRTGYKLDIETELRAIGRVLGQSDKSLVARRIPPTAQHLRSALKQGPAILHLSAHGNVINIKTEDGAIIPQAILALEDDTGREEPLRGDHLLRLPPRGVLRLVLFSACHTAASALDASLARQMVLAGTPAAIGMQGGFPDPLSDELAANLYDFLLAGYNLAESLRQARHAISPEPHAIGLPVAYVAPNGWAALPLRSGSPQLGPLTRPHPASLPPVLEAPRPFMGRETELHQLARLFHQKPAVVTVVGSGGIGKTALSAAFAERFGWLFAGGVVGLSLANRPSLNPETLFGELLERVTAGQLSPDVFVKRKQPHLISGCSTTWLI
ncbi:MAG: CHAT domain-containing protein [Anaerolineae bacterium]|nr:CHAT domain-containing protein [Anaerolineae bacterium]